jgi:hypothetical protein
VECIEDISEKARKKRPLGRPKRRWVNNVKMDGCVGWIYLAQERVKWRALVNMVLKLRIA